MITELALLRLVPGAGPRFEAAFESVRTLLADAEGCIRHRLVPTIDDPDLYLLEVHWRDLSAHVEGFEPSDAHSSFMAAIAPHLTGEPVVVHVPPTPVQGLSQPCASPGLAQTPR